MDFYFYLRALFILGVMVAMIFICVYGLRRFLPFFGHLKFTQKHRHIALIDMVVLDQRHKAVLLKCFDQGYLVVLGGQSPCLLEKDIDLSSQQQDDKAEFKKDDVCSAG